MANGKIECPNPDCIDGYLYHHMGGMVIPLNKPCPDCSPAAPPNPHNLPKWEPSTDARYRETRRYGKWEE